MNDQSQYWSRTSEEQQRATEGGEQALRQAVQAPLDQTVQFQKNVTELLLNGLEMSNRVQSQSIELTRDVFDSYLDTVENAVRSTEQLTETGIETIQAQQGAVERQFQRPARQQQSQPQPSRQYQPHQRPQRRPEPQQDQQYQQSPPPQQQQPHQQSQQRYQQPTQHYQQPRQHQQQQQPPQYQQRTSAPASTEGSQSAAESTPEPRQSFDERGISEQEPIQPPQENQ